MLTITNAKLPNKNQNQLFQITLNQGTITTIDLMENKTPKGDVLDINGDWLSLGGVDLQINGGLGLAFPDLNPQYMPILHKISRYLWQEGIDGYCPTIVTTAVDKIHQSLAVLADFMRQQEAEEARVLGVHLEGPFLNFAKRGAHPEQYLLPLNIENVKRILGDYSSIVKIMTLAPELEPEGETVSYLKNLGITVSLGHSLATAAEAKTAFAKGATMVTHGFNAMPSLHHREPGLLGEAIAQPQVFCGLIADGQHVCPTMMQILLRASGEEQGVFLVSDALAPIGLPDGLYPWDTRQIEVKNGTARLQDGTLSGTTLPLLVGVQNLVEWGLTSPTTAINLATESPRHAIGLTGLETGKNAHLLRWSMTEKKLAWQRVAQASCLWTINN